MPQATRATAGGNHAQRARARPRRPAAPGTAEHVLRLQRTAGNRATRAMIQRLDWGDVWDVVKGPVWRIGDIGGVLGPGGNIVLDYGVKELFAKVVIANRARSTTSAAGSATSSPAPRR